MTRTPGLLLLLAASTCLTACLGSIEQGFGGEPGATDEPTPAGQPGEGPMPGPAVAADGGARDAAPRGSDGSSAPDACTGVTCGAHAHCAAGSCACDPGYAPQGGACTLTPIGNPATRSEAEVCGAYKAAMGRNANGFTRTTATCDPGAPSAQGIDDAVARINFHRWLVGLGPTRADASQSASAQKCALISAWNPAGQQAHSPAPGATCYSAEGAGSAGRSNIAWGSGSPANAIDQWIEDWGNQTTMGHRRWILNPALDPVGLGYYEGGNNYGSAACLEVFGMGNPGPSPDWFAYPPAGYAPAPLTGWTWTFHATRFDATNADVKVTRKNDGAALAVEIRRVFNAFGNFPSAVSWVPQGWQPRAGETYAVTVTAGTNIVTYEVTPTGCP